MRSSVLIRAGIAAALIAALALSGCGRRGPLEPPPAADVSQSADDASTPEQPDKSDKPDKPFVLDGLL